MPGRTAPGQPTDTRRFWVWVFGEIAGLRWVLEHDCMAFPETAVLRVMKMRKGDRAVLYVSRGAFHNPTRGNARLMGLVQVTGAAPKKKPVTIERRAFARQVDFKPERLLQERTGPLVRSIVDNLQMVKRPEVWGVYFRSSPIEVTEADFQIMARAIQEWKPR